LILITEADLFTSLLERLRMLEEGSYILGHFYKANDEELKGQGFLAVGEMFKMTQINVTNLATRSIRTEGGYR
jgi:hypothetical protein